MDGAQLSEVAVGCGSWVGVSEDEARCVGDGEGALDRAELVEQPAQAIKARLTRHITDVGMSRTRDTGAIRGMRRFLYANEQTASGRHSFL